VGGSAHGERIRSLTLRVNCTWLPTIADASGVNGAKLYVTVTVVQTQVAGAQAPAAVDAARLAWAGVTVTQVLQIMPEGAAAWVAVVTTASLPPLADTRAPSLAAPLMVTS
jgi:hypothetical protein